MITTILQRMEHPLYLRKGQTMEGEGAGGGGGGGWM